MRNTVLDLTLQLIILRLLDVFKREKEEQKAKSEDDSDEEPRPYLTSLHNLLQSLFSVCEDYSNTTMVYNANRLSSWKISFE